MEDSRDQVILQILLENPDGLRYRDLRKKTEDIFAKRTFDKC